ncbi:MAG: radical SAM family heme chaperone HemW [Phycisphaerales bacterium]
MPELTPLTLSQQRPSSATPMADIQHPVRSLYIHIPFCFHKCHYCDFYSFVDNRDRQGEFTDRLIEELTAIARHAGPSDPSSAPPARPALRPALNTIFVGGGTPSLLKPALWERLLAALHERFDLAPDGTACEFTVECNPETVTPTLMDTLHRGGVNRVSIGAQSFDPRHLKTLERWHDPDNVDRALRMAADAGIHRRSIDLIYAIPGQTLDDWKRDLDRALALGDADPQRGAIDHLSCYALTYEPNTAMTKRLARGDFEPADEDTEVAMCNHTVSALRDAGFERYEVSNFARHGPTPGAGCRCRHNLVYWGHAGDGQWLAAGPSGSAHAAGHRWKNLPHLGDWMLGVQRTNGYAPIVDHEPPDPRRALAERIMLALRVAEGLDADATIDHARRLDPTGATAERLIAAAEEQTRLDLLEHDTTGDPHRWRLTERGHLFADGIAATLMATLKH